MSGLGWNAGFRFLGQVFTWGITLFVVRLLSPADYGLMELAGLFVSFLSMIGEFGLGSAIIQHHNLKEKELRSIFGLILGVSLLLCASLSMTAPLIAKYYSEPKLSPIIWFLSLTFMLSGLATVPYSLLMREQNYRTIAIIDFVSTIFGSITTLIFALYGFGVWALVAGALSTKITSMIVLLYVQPFIKIPLFRFRGMGPLLVFSGNVTISRILWHFYSFAAATLIIGKVLGKEALGIYGIALFLASVPMEKVGGILNQVAFPAFSSVQHNPHLVGSHFLKTTRILTIVSVPVFWGISSVAPEIIGVFLGAKWDDAVLPLQIIALTMPFRMVRNLTSPALLGLGHSKINLINEATAAVLMPISFYFATRWGLVGISSVWLLVFPLVFLMNLPQTTKALFVSMWDVFLCMLRPIFAGLAMIAGIEIFRKSLFGDISMVLRMLVCIVIGATIYLASMFIVNRRGVNEVIGLFKK